jgi:monofunctional biosynthetic peptidoglycan transglycosylase
MKSLRRLTRRVWRLIIGTLALLFVYAMYIFVTLPDVRTLRASNPKSTAFIELRAREARRKGDQPRRVQQWVPYSRLSPQLVRAVLLTEDAKFWRHDGLDYEQIKESVEINLERGEFARGASTITQQLAKNLYLSPSKNPVRKLRELLIARRLEEELTKQRILEVYLNVIEWGDGIYGAEAASRTYFGRSSASLSAPEAAMLAASIANPRVMNPGNVTARLRRRQSMVLRRMGFVEPPPVIVTVPSLPEQPFVLPPTDPVPALPPVEGLPPTPPGQPVPPPKKPGGGGQGH